MKQIFKILPIFILLSNPAFSQCRLDMSGWHQVFSDEFNDQPGQMNTYQSGPNNGLNPTKWCSGPQCNFLGQDIEYYLPSQISFLQGAGSDGFMRFTAERITPGFNTTVNNVSRDFNYKSGGVSCVTDIDHYSWADWAHGGFLYGAMEVRARIPSGDMGCYDAWPTIWLYNGSGEIDIVDNLSINQEGEYIQDGVITHEYRPKLWNTSITGLQNVAAWTPLLTVNSNTPLFKGGITYYPNDVVKEDGVDYVANANSQYPNHAIPPITCGGVMTKSPTLPTLGGEWHTYGLVWTPLEATFFLDGREIRTVRFRSAANNSPKPYLYGHVAPQQIIIQLQVKGDAIDCTSDESKKFYMDIDYVRVFKPNATPESDWSNISYKSSESWLNRRLLDNNQANTYAKKNFADIVYNPGANEVFYHGTNDLLYRLYNPTGYSWDRSWTNEVVVPTTTVSGHLKFNPVNGTIMFRGTDGLLHFANHWLNNGSWVWSDNIYFQPQPIMVIGGMPIFNNDDFPLNVPGTFNYMPNGDPMYVESNSKKICTLKQVGNTWVRQTLGNYFNNPNKLVMGDLLCEGTQAIHYKGMDGRIQCLWFNPNTQQLESVYIDDFWNTNAFLVNSKPGSMIRGANEDIVYIGADNKIHRFYFDPNTNDWQHDNNLFLYNYSSVDMALGNIGWDGAAKRIVYIGYDNRVQYFQRTWSGTWFHGWIDDYWNTREYEAANTSSSDRASISCGDGFYVYAARDQIIRAFSWEPCEYDYSYSDYRCNFGWQGNQNLNRNANNNVSQPLNETGKPNMEALHISPNPTTGDFVIYVPRVGHYSVSVTNMVGALVYKGEIKNEQKKEMHLPDDLPSGNYIVHIIGDEFRHVEKLTIIK